MNKNSPDFLPSGTRRKLMVGTAALLGAGLVPRAWAAAANGPLRLVIPYPVGGSTDIAGRMLAHSVGEALNRNIVPDNKGGAAGLIGMRDFLRAPADGTTLAISGIGTSVLLGLTKKDMPYEFEKDVEAVAHLGAFGNLIVTRPNSPFSTLQELVEYARANPGKVNCGTPPLGSPSNMTLEYLCLEAGMQIVGVPYQGHTQILTDVLGGQIEIGLVSVPQAQELVRTGGIKALAVTSEARAKALPDVPTVAESGFAGFEASLWNVLVMRKGTPQDVLETFNKATNEAFSGPEIQAQLAQHNIEFRPHTLQETTEFVRREQQKWARIVKGAGITPS